MQEHAVRRERRVQLKLYLLIAAFLTPQLDTHSTVFP
jgi:hypothetical protein